MPLLRTIPYLPVVDISRAVAFYRDRLGFRCLHEESSFAIVARDMAEIHLWAADDDGWADRDPSGEPSPVISGAETFIAGTASCRIEVSDLDELYTEMRRSGVLYDATTVIETRPWGQRDFSVLDPWRNLIAFYERVER